MANPKKNYKIPCQLLFPFGMVGKVLAMVDIIKYGKKEYQINAVPIEVDNLDEM